VICDALKKVYRGDAEAQKVNVSGVGMLPLLKVYSEDAETQRCGAYLVLLPHKGRVNIDREIGDFSTNYFQVLQIVDLLITILQHYS
jgi:hypothetical protein